MGVITFRLLNIHILFFRFSILLDLEIITS